MRKIKKVAILGAGSVGGYFGAVLTRAGADVWLIARGKNLEVLKSKGVFIETPNDSFTTSLNVTDNSEEVGPADLLLVCVKSQDTEEVIRNNLALINENTHILSIQNGLENEEKIAQIVNKEQIIPGFTPIGANRKDYGHIVVTFYPKLTFGELDGKDSERTKALKSFFDSHNLICSVSNEITLDMWKKFLWNIGFNQVTAMKQQTISELLADPESMNQMKNLMREVISLANAKEIPLTEEDISDAISRVENSNSQTSMFQDVIHNRQTEFESFSGYVIHESKKLGIKTLENQKVYDYFSNKTQSTA